MQTNPKKLEKVFQIARLSRTSTNVYEKRGAKNLLAEPPHKIYGNEFAGLRIE